MSQKLNNQRYKRLHNWYYLYRDTAKPKKVEINFKLRQRVLGNCLEDELNGKPLSRLVVRALYDGIDDVLSGYYNKLLSPVNIGRGAQGHHPIDVTMMRTAVSYIALCKAGKFKRKSHIKFVCDSYGVSRSTVQNWYDDSRFDHWRNEPLPFSSQESAEQTLLGTGEIYRNNRKGRKKA